MLPCGLCYPTGRMKIRKRRSSSFDGTAVRRFDFSPAPARPRCVRLAALALLPVILAGCARNPPRLSADQEMAVELLLPARIRVQPWTSPISHAGGGEADGLEVLIAAEDIFGDQVKTVGVMQLELHSRRMASADRRDRRLGFWSIDLNEPDAQLAYWDRTVRFYRFPIRLDSGRLPPGRYILDARLQLPEDHRVSDEYEFSYTGGGQAARPTP